MPDNDYFRCRQARASPKGDLKPYWGKWIAVRDSEIVASGSSLAEVRSRHDVRPTDLVMPVPRPEGDFLILGTICETMGRSAPIAQLDRATPPNRGGGAAVFGSVNRNTRLPAGSRIRFDYARFNPVWAARTASAQYELSTEKRLLLQAGLQYQPGRRREIFGDWLGRNWDSPHPTRLERLTHRPLSQSSAPTGSTHATRHARQSP